MTELFKNRRNGSKYKILYFFITYKSFKNKNLNNGYNPIKLFGTSLFRARFAKEIY